MASPLHAAICAIVAMAFWTLLGAGIGRRLLPRQLVWPLAPSLGWAVHSAVALPLLWLAGFSATHVIILAVATLGAVMILLRGVAADDVSGGGRVPWWVYIGAALLALAPAVAVLPHAVAGGVQLSAPIFDHAKVAMIDGFARLGLPPANPFFGEYDGPDRLAYYYLWHFSAGELAAALGVSGWDADIALTWFTGFASLTMVCGLAVWISERRGAAVWALVVAATGSLRDLLSDLLGPDRLRDLLAYPNGFSGWMFQSAWVPQHLASATCVVIAMLLIVRLPVQGGWLALATLVLVIVAGFESSTWVGGVAFVAVMLAAAPFLLLQVAPKQRLRFCLALAAAALLSVALATPFLVDQFAAVAARHGGSPIAIQPVAVLGEGFQPALRRILDLPGYWLILLVVEFPGYYLPGGAALTWLLWSRRLDDERRNLATGFAALVVACLAVSWLGSSTLGYNNDLGLRAVLPALLVLIACAAAGMSLWIADRSWFAVGAVIVALSLSLPAGAKLVYYNVIGRSSDDAAVFAQSPDLWAAVRRHTAPDERVANNPLFLQRMTPWPVDISWALLSNRSSCFAGRELALAYAPLSPQRRDEIDAQFIRVFDGAGTPQDIDDLAHRYGCNLAVVTAQDGAWMRDPFAGSSIYHLVEEQPDRWRIYRRVAADEPAKSR